MKRYPENYDSPYHVFDVADHFHAMYPIPTEWLSAEDISQEEALAILHIELSPKDCLSNLEHV